MMLTYSTLGSPPPRAADLEQAGVDIGWVPELYGFDAVSILGYLAAKTETMQLGSGHPQYLGRTPSTIAMTTRVSMRCRAAGSSLGWVRRVRRSSRGSMASSTTGPLGRQREIMEICRKV